MNNWYFCCARQILFASMLLGPLALSAEAHVETSSFAQVQVIKVTRYDNLIAQRLIGDGDHAIAVVKS
jgi:hypothetical protein